MVRNPKQPVIHGAIYTYESRHGCRCYACVVAYRVISLEREMRRKYRNYLWLFEEVPSEGTLSGV